VADGKVKDRKLLNNQCLFHNMVFSGGLSVSDIDVAFEYRNKLFIDTEVKHINCRGIIPIGQRIMYERRADMLSNNEGVSAYVLFAMHSEDGDVDVGTLSVELIYENGKWRSPSRSCTVRDFHQQKINMIDRLGH
tara:strand:- start:31306 stop:31710 length:405 start_codon:yes stop_codon:yes gene_type:complete